jgi:hypothetical protein
MEIVEIGMAWEYCKYIWFKDIKKLLEHKPGGGRQKGDLD